MNIIIISIMIALNIFVCLVIKVKLDELKAQNILIETYLTKIKKETDFVGQVERRKNRERKAIDENN